MSKIVAILFQNLKKMPFERSGGKRRIFSLFTVLLILISPFASFETRAAPIVAADIQACDENGFVLDAFALTNEDEVSCRLLPEAANPSLVNARGGLSYEAINAPESLSDTFNEQGNIQVGPAGMEVNDIAIDTNGYIYITGELELQDDTYAYVTKLDSSGNTVWNYPFTGTTFYRGEGIALDSNGNIYVTGSSGDSIDIALAKLSNDGTLQWMTTWGTASYGDRGHQVAVDGTGNIYVTGASGPWGSPIQPYTSGVLDAFVAKFEPALGNIVWNTFLGPSLGGFGFGIAVDSSGYVYVTGKNQPTNAVPDQASNVFVVSLDTNGNELWYRTVGAAANPDEGRDIALDEAGNIYVAGVSFGPWGTPLNAFSGSPGSKDAVVFKMDSAGDLQWNTFLGTSGWDMGYGIDLDASGNIYVSGNSTGTWGNPFPSETGQPQEIFAVKLNNSGVLQWNTFIQGEAWYESWGNPNRAAVHNGTVYVLSHITVDDEDGLHVVPVSFITKVTGYSLHPVAEAVKDEVEGNWLEYYGNSYEGLINLPPGRPAFERFGDLAATAEYEVDFVTMGWDPDKVPNVTDSPGDYLIGDNFTQGIKTLYERVKANPGDHVVRVRILLGLRYYINGLQDQRIVVLDDLADQGIPTQDTNWSVVVASYRNDSMASGKHSHVKMMIVDGKQVIASGYNMHYNYLESNPVHDMGVQVSGPIALSTLEVFDGLWLGSTGCQRGNFDLVICNPVTDAPHDPAILAPASAGNDVVFSLFRDDNDKTADNAIETAINAAESNVNIIQNRFMNNDFWNPPQYARAVLNALQKGDGQVSVNLLVTGTGSGTAGLDDLTTNIRGICMLKDQQMHEDPIGWVNHRLVTRFSSKANPIHTKALSIDGTFIVVGSQNWDESAWGNDNSLPSFGDLAEYSLGVSSIEAANDFNNKFYEEFAPENGAHDIPCPYSTSSNPSLQDVVNQASPGAAIFVPGGIYDASVTIDKPLILIGTGADRTVIRPNANEPAFRVTSSDVTIMNMKISGGDSYGIELIDSSPSSLRNIQINRVVFENNVQGGILAQGLIAGSPMNYSIENSTFIGGADGITINMLETQADTSIVRNNIFSDQSVAPVHILSSDDSRVEYSYNLFNDCDGGSCTTNWHVGSPSSVSSEHDNLFDLDPLFADPANSAYQLSAGSPAIDTGDPTLLHDFFYDGNNDGIVQIDLGAFEAPPYETAPTVSSIMIAGAQLGSVTFTVTFSEPVIGVDASDFALNVTGLPLATIVGVSGSDATYTVTVSTGVSQGTIRLDVLDDDSIVDLTTNLLGGTGVNNGNYYTGEVHEVFYSLARASVSAEGVEGDLDSDLLPASISADGRYVVFDSEASNLVEEDTNDVKDVFLHDTLTNVTTLISVAMDGTVGNDSSNDPSISADGRYVAFTSYASNLVSGDTNGSSDIFVRDTQTGATTRVSLAADGTQGNNLSSYPSISANGRYIVFRSFASNLVSGDANGEDDIFLRDTQTNTTTLITVATDGTQARHPFLFESSVSADGRYVAFASYADNLVSGDTNGISDIFVRDTQTGTTTCISVAPDGSIGNEYSFGSHISADGRYVAFFSGASNLVSGDTNGTRDIFVRDLQTNTTRRVSVATDGTQGNGTSDGPSISADGRYIAFYSDASNLVGADTNEKRDVFLHDTQTGITTRISVAANGTEGNGWAFGSAISADGRSIAYSSDADNLVGGDMNEVTDIFVLKSFAAPPPLYVVDSARASANPTSAESVSFSVTFSESVTGVDVSDFAITTTGVPGAAVAEVSGSGATYTVTVDTGSNSGTIRLDVVDDDTIVNAHGDPLGGSGLGNGNFTIGEVYNVVRSAASTLVTKLADTNDGSCDADCSLREAIAVAAPTDTVTFDAALSGETIHLTSSLVLSRDITIDGSALAEPITISGDTDNDGTPDVRVFKVDTGVTATLNGLTISRGRGVGYGIAGGIFNLGTLTVANSTISDNSASYGGGISNWGTLTVTNSTFSGNSVTDGYGGGIHSEGIVTVSNSTFSHNSASYGGGIYNEGGVLTVTNSTFSANSADQGGGIFTFDGLTITNSTFSANSASEEGAGIHNYDGTLNYANTIIANSLSGGDCANGGTLGTNLANLVEDGSCSAPLSGDPRLGPLTDHGGPTQTMALLIGSPAIDTGDDTVCAAAPINNLDQRGNARPYGLHCDIGAFEYYDEPPVVESIAIANTTLESVDFTVTFSKDVTGVDVSDFILTTTDVSGATVSGVSGSGAMYTVSVQIGTGEGTIRLDVLDDDTIIDSGSRPLNGGFTGGATYSIRKVVNKLTDTNDGACDTDCSLREAIAVAAPTDTITFDASLSGGTINLVSSLVLSKDITIDASGLAVPITISGDANGDGGGYVRVFYINSGVTATLRSLTVSNGHASDTGGAIYNLGMLTVTDDTFLSSSAYFGGVIYNAGVLTVTESTFSGNSASSGGSIYNTGKLTVTNSTFSGNSGSSGAGIYSDGTELTVTNSSFSRNSAGYGAGIYSDGNQLTITGSTFFSNSGGSGAGVYNKGILSITNSTFSENSSGKGGGVYNEGALTITNSTFSGGYGAGVYNLGSLNYANTIIANSASGVDCVNNGTLGTNTANLVEDGSCSASLSGDPNLGELADHGGPTQTMALLPGSPALDDGDDAVCAAAPVNNLDQRGNARPQGAHCDIGSYEAAIPAVLSSVRADPNPTSASGVSFTVTFSEPVTGVDASDFALTTTDILDATISSVSGSDTTYTVSVNTGSGNGTIRLDVLDDDTIMDAASMPLGGTGADNGNFTAGEEYYVAHNPVSVAVTVLDTDGTPQAGVNVYAFNGTVYAGYSRSTNVDGQAIFTLPLGSYRFRADFNGTQFWSGAENHCAVPDCGSAGITVSKAMTVTVLNTDGTPKAGLNVYAFNASTYTGYSKITNAEGQAVFTLQLGGYRFRADYNGTQFWSGAENHCDIPGCASASITVTEPVTVTVLGTDGAPKVGLRVYAFDGTTYTGYSKTTNTDGQAVFTLPQGNYHFRADLNGTQFWSGTENHCAIPGCTSVQIEITQPMVVTVQDTNNEPTEELHVYAFNGATYTGHHGVTDANGRVSFTLPQGDYRFRADLNGTQFWSGAENHCTLPGCESAGITVTIPMTVTVLDTDGAGRQGLPVYAFNGSTYTGYSKTTDANGQAVFTLPQGNYRFRADYNGTQFWSGASNHCDIPGCLSAGVTITNSISVTVQDTDNVLQSGLRVYAFNGSTYTGYTAITDADGQVNLTLPVGSYRFRADYNGTQFWSAVQNHCDIPGCVSASVTISKPVTVTVLDSNGMSKEGLRVYAFNGSTYAGYSKLTDANGQATFTLPLGSYRFRTDLNGTQFWSGAENHCDVPGCASASVTVSTPVTVTVLDTDGASKEGLRVYAFNGSIYTGYSKTTNADGQAVFTLPLGNYRFRADLNGTQFWSAPENHCDISDCGTASVTVSQPVTVTVLNSDGTPWEGLHVYAFHEDTYTGYSQVSDTNGQVIFTLPLGEYRFRIDQNGTQYWSDSVNHCTLPGCLTVTVTIASP